MTTREEAFDLVRLGLGLHLEISPEAIRLEQRLEQDLGLDALDLILVVLRLDELSRAEHAIADLERVHTVADLVSMIHGWMTPRRPASGLFAVTPHAPIIPELGAEDEDVRRVS